jgi:hypothetical protein
MAVLAVRKCPFDALKSGVTPIGGGLTGSSAVSLITFMIGC